MQSARNWATDNGQLKSAMPCTANTHAAILRTVHPEGVNVVVESDAHISISGHGKTIHIWGRKP